MVNFVCMAPSIQTEIKAFVQNQTSSGSIISNEYLTYSAFTLKGFDDQERNLTFVKTDFQVLKLKFHACILLQAFRSVPGCQTSMCKLGISL